VSHIVTVTDLLRIHIFWQNMKDI